jgi:L-threonylcarbamoyladenylate synthase
VRSWQTPEQLRALLVELGERETGVAIVAHTVVPGSGGFRRVAVIPRDPEAYARELYSELHECDESGARLILVEDLPAGPEWHAARDRLSRAAGHPPA